MAKKCPHGVDETRANERAGNDQLPCVVCAQAAITQITLCVMYGHEPERYKFVRVYDWGDGVVEEDDRRDDKKICKRCGRIIT